MLFFTGSAIPSRVSLLILNAQAESGAYSRNSPAFRGGVHLFFYLYRHPPSGQSRVYRVTQLRTDGQHCRESAGTRPVVLKMVSVTGAAFSGITMDQLICASLFPHPPLVQWIFAIQKVVHIRAGGEELTFGDGAVLSKGLRRIGGDWRMWVGQHKDDGCWLEKVEATELEVMDDITAFMAMAMAHNTYTIIYLLYILCEVRGNKERTEP